MSKIELVKGSCLDYDVEVKLCAFTDKEYASAAKRFERGEQ